MTDDRLSTLNLMYTYVRLWLLFYTKHEQANGKYDCFFPFVLNEISLRRLFMLTESP